MTGFEVFRKSLVPDRSEPTLTIQKNGVISLNMAALSALDRPKAVELLFDRERRIVGLRAVHPGEPHAYPVRSVAGPNAAPFVISAMAYLRFYEIQQGVSRRWSAQLRGEILCVDLDADSRVVTSNRAKIRPDLRPASGE